MVIIILILINEDKHHNNQCSITFCNFSKNPHRLNILLLLHLLTVGRHLVGPGVHGDQLMLVAEPRLGGHSNDALSRGGGAGEPGDEVGPLATQLARLKTIIMN